MPNGIEYATNLNDDIAGGRPHCLTKSGDVKSDTYHILAWHWHSGYAHRRRTY